MNQLHMHKIKDINIETMNILLSCNLQEPISSYSINVIVGNWLISVINCGRWSTFKIIISFVKIFRGHCFATSLLTATRAFMSLLRPLWKFCKGLLILLDIEIHKNNGLFKNSQRTKMSKCSNLRSQWVAICIVLLWFINLECLL